MAGKLGRGRRRIRQLMALAAVGEAVPKVVAILLLEAVGRIDPTDFALMGVTPRGHRDDACGTARRPPKVWSSQHGEPRSEANRISGTAVSRSDLFGARC